MNEEEFYHNVRRLREKYNSLVQIVPATDDKKAVKEVKHGKHPGAHVVKVNNREYVRDNPDSSQKDNVNRKK